MATTPGAPGVAQSGTVVFNEDFENGTDDTALGAQSYSASGSTAYTGASGQTYTGSPQRINGIRCNGVILSHDNTTTPAWAVSGSAGTATNNRCADSSGVRSYQFLRMLALAMGQEFTPNSPATNHVNSSYTECRSTSTSSGTCDTLPTGPTDGLMFKTAAPIAVAPGHYYTFGVDTAYMNCGLPAGDPSYQFARSDELGNVTLIGAPLNGCQSTTDPNVTSSEQEVTSNVGGVFGTVTKSVRINSMTSDVAFQATTESLGLEMWNTNGTTDGNDGAFDNVRLVDVTPQLDKSFTPGLIGPGGTSTLTLTVTNTDELNAKSDWTITDTLPAGVVVADVPNLGGTCVQAPGTDPFLTTANPGGNVITVTGGDLASRMVSCTITVDVTAAAEGTYVNGPANIATNLNPPADASLVVRAPRLALSKALGAERTAAADQFTVEIREGSATGTVVNNTANSTTTGSGAAVSAGTGVTGQYVANAGSTYYLTESGPNLSGYAKAISCTDANGLQTGLPRRAAFGGSLELVPVAGADISCVLTNTAVQAPQLTFTKMANPSGIQSPSQVGDVISYTFTAANNGNVALSGVVIDDPLAGLSPLVYTWPGTPGTLLPGETVTATATYAITQADVDAGHVANSAVATGNPPTGPPLTTPPSGTDTPLTKAPALQFSKMADTSAIHKPAVVGDVITYTFTARNTGNVKLTDVTIDDPMAGLSPLVFNWPGNPGELFPGESVTAKATYAITQADIDAGHVVNSATITGAPPAGPAVTPPPGVTDTPLTSAPAMEFSKTATAAASDGPSRVGDHIVYRFTAKNNGNVKLNKVSIDDQMEGLSALTYVWPGTPGELLPGESVTAEATYTVTQGDIDAGHVANLATTTGTPPTGPVVAPPAAGTDTPLSPDAGFAFFKTADGSAIGDPAKVGDIITFNFTAKNTGNVVLTDVAIRDAMPGLSALDHRWPGTPGVLNPGETVTAKATYAITQADINAGQVFNTATASAGSTTGSLVSTPPANVVINFPTTEATGPDRAEEPLAFTGVVLTVLPISVLIVGAGLVLFLVGRRKKQAARP
ncbi:hypothetical protein RI444_01365 [Paenarthrobacter sp. AT5]|uniref:DUF7507 domain-containing protein n=1 Tax=Paenarthrobacter TaxID=1742992 RepID=UPI001F60C7C3|nr:MULTISPECIES: hypothetical protein [Paenarthrobacter]WOC61341.1 hypothetical protein RI444_01365 [Paenarthrobacter sp. AT5]